MKLVLILMVKNESAILRRCLEAVKDVVDAYCILDTGSSDTTVEIAEDFLENQIGCVTVEPWKDFGYNRTVSFQRAQAYLKEQCWDLKDTYGLLLDADMVFKPGKLKEQDLQETGYTVVQVAGTLEYPNTRLVRMDYPWTCIGVTHEYWGGPTATTVAASRTSLSVTCGCWRGT
jgi:glycosyltransferase involved in cell wall biosynthesis